jgi:hypothetical protein
LLGLAATGCASQIGVGRATTIERGHGEVMGLAQLDVMSPQSNPNGNAVPLPWAHVGFGYHRGLTDRLEVGGRAWFFGLPQHLSWGMAADSKVQIFRGEPGKGLSLAVAPSFAYHQPQIGGTPWHTFTGSLPVLLGQDFGPHQFVVGPRAGYTLWAGEGQNTIHIPWFGGSTGVSFGVGRNAETKIMPEIVLVYSPLSFNGAVESERFGATLFQLGLSASH